jgi:ribokinase
MSKLFVAYRRDDSADVSWRLHEKLEGHFGPGTVFIDIGAMPLGVDWRKHLADEVNQCDVLLAVIGDHWLDAAYQDGPKKGTRRLDDPQDYVRFEVESALARGIPVVPLLVGRTAMPPEVDLPDGLKELAYRHAAVVRSGPDFHGQVDRLIRGLEQLLARKQELCEGVREVEQPAALGQRPARLGKLETNRIEITEPSRIAVITKGLRSTATLELWFRRDERGLILARTRFANSESKIAINREDLRGNKTFPMSNGVRGFVALMLNWAAWGRRPPGSNRDGESFAVNPGSAAQSVHGLMHQHHQWAEKLLGTNTTNVHVYDLIREATHDGRVKLSLNENIISHNNIFVYLDDSRVEDPGKLVALAQEFDSKQPLSQRARAGQLPPPGVARTKAFEEIMQRIKANDGHRLDAFAVTAHNLDQFALVDEIRPDHETSLRAPLEEHPSGSGANTIYGLARLGRKVGVAGIIARDSGGNRLKKDLKSAGVDISALLEIDAEAGWGSGRTRIEVDSEARRHIVVDVGVNSVLASEIGKSHSYRDKIIESIRCSRIVHFSSFRDRAEMKLQEEMIGHIPEDAILSFMPGALYSKLGLSRLEPILRRTNVLFLCQEQLRTLMGALSTGEEDVRELFQWRVRENHREPLLVVIEPGHPPIRGVSHPDQAAIICGHDTPEASVRPSPRFLSPSNVVKDTTGAGDALAAGVLFGLLEGVGLARCADLGFEMAICASSAVGARPGLPTREELLRGISGQGAQDAVLPTLPSPKGNH